MDISRLKSFYMVATLGNFSEAADQLYIAQSTVSKHIMSLEQELGIPLLYRNGKTFALTEAGKKMLRYYAEILEVYDKSLIALEEIKRKEYNSYELKVVGGNRMSHYGLINSLAAFMRIHPEVKLNIDDAATKNVLFALNSGDYELAFCRENMLDVNTFSWQHYMQDYYIATVSVESKLAKRDALFLSDLKGKRIILGSQDGEHCQRVCAKEGYELDIEFETNDPATAIEILISTEDCIYIAPKTVMLKYPGKLTKQIPLKGMGDCSYVLAWRKKEVLSKCAKDYLAYLRSQSAELFIQESLERKISIQNV
ncbi:MAG: LysR family transcriptional regulator [Eubacterium sp.]|nr:LysR family transcriptional regulator [Eubacterium sp.]